jgi:hypothetical protein
MRILLVFAFAASLHAQTGVVEGRVTSSTTHEGISGARAMLTMIAEPKTVYSATTDASGTFRFDSLPRGEYAPNYLAWNYLELTPMLRARNVLNVAPGRDAIRVEVELVPLARVTGRTIDNVQQPIPNAEVIIRPTGEAFVRVARSGPDGAFVFDSMVPGSITVSALAVNPKSNAWESQPVIMRLRPGEQLNSFDVVMRAVPLIKIRGEVLDPSGKPVRGITVEAIPDRPPILRLESTAVTNQDGAFEMPLRPGGWYLTAKMTSDPKWYGTTRVSAGESDVEAVRIRVIPRFHLSASVEGIGANRVGIFLRVFTGTPESWPLRYGDPLPGFVDVAPGRARIDVRDIPPGLYLESIYFGQLEVLGRGFDLYDDSQPVRLVFQSGAGSASGKVENGAEAKVVFMPQEEHLRLASFIHVASCDSSGRFLVTGLRPGKYYAIAFPEIRSEALLMFVEPLLSQAARVEVKRNAFPSVDLQLSEWPQ